MHQKLAGELVLVCLSILGAAILVTRVLGSGSGCVPAIVTSLSLLVADKVCNGPYLRRIQMLNLGDQIRIRGFLNNAVVIVEGIDLGGIKVRQPDDPPGFEEYIPASDFVEAAFSIRPATSFLQAATLLAEPNPQV